MRRSIFKERFFVFFFIFLSVFLATLLACLFILLKLEDQNSKNIQKYNRLYLLADECRQTSDDLSTMARLYVLTGNKKYVELYNDIVSIRKGILPLPMGYNEVYWDLVLDSNKVIRSYGEAISFTKRINEESMSAQRRDLLKISQRSSEFLGELEIEAINAMQGNFKNAAGIYFLKAEPNPELARRLVSDAEYIKRKAATMKPLQEFYNQIDQEIDSQIAEFEKTHQVVLLISIALLVCIAFGMIFSLIKALKSLMKATESNENLLLSALPPAISERLKHGEESSVKECEACVLFLDVGMESKNEGKESQVLQDLYKEIDQLVETFKVERIRTLQGNYMVASGISGEVSNYVENLADFALAAQDRIRKCGEIHQLKLYIKAGMASGTVIAGVLDHKKYIYDLWGDVLKVANSLESNGVKGEIQITKKLESQMKGSFEMVAKEGEEKIYFLKRRIFKS